ncbi:MAG: SCE4755 family polysaccharide monooxygenase-like protein [Polyangiales bacterium]
MVEGSLAVCDEGSMKKLVLASLLFASPAYAHIRVVNMTSRDGDAQKDGPCGAVGSQWGANGVTTLEPGATMSVTINEYIAHPGYFRIAFGEQGQFKSPASIQPIVESRRKFNERDQDTGSDFCNNPTVLMDNLDAHRSGGGMRSYDVKLPNIECERCTLQIVQVMEDTVHGPYNLELGGTFDLPDLYYQCIDVTLKGPASGEKPACTIGPLVDGQTKSSQNDAGADEPTSSQKGDDGCALAHAGSGGWFALLLLALLRKNKLAISRSQV